MLEILKERYMQQEQIEERLLQKPEILDILKRMKESGGESELIA